MYLIEKALTKLERRKDEEHEEMERVCAELFSDCSQLLSKHGKRKPEQLTLIVVVHKTERPIEILLTSGRAVIFEDGSHAPISGINIAIEGVEEHLNLAIAGSKVVGRLYDTHNSFAHRVPSLRDIQHWHEVIEFVKQKHPLDTT